MLVDRRMCAVLALLAAACTSQPDDAEFKPPAATYDASRATIEGVSGLRPVASVDSTFFGRNLPMLGRLFIAQDYAGGTNVLILSHPFWQERFGGRPDVIGSTLEVDGVEATIVGIMPLGVNVPDSVALWLPRVPQQNSRRRP